jgi:4-hydroxy-tetrahydrodipicolinate synthase
VCRLALNGFFSDALAIDENLNLLHKRLFVAPSPAPAKWILQQFGLISCANVRLPLLCLEPIDHNAVKEAMKMAGLI